MIETDDELEAKEKVKTAKHVVYGKFINGTVIIDNSGSSNAIEEDTLSFKRFIEE